MAKVTVNVTRKELLELLVGLVDKSELPNTIKTVAIEAIKNKSTKELYEKILWMTVENGDDIGKYLKGWSLRDANVILDDSSEDILVSADIKNIKE